VIVDTERARRPVDFERVKQRPTEGYCPYCPGNESRNPAEILSNRAAESKPNHAAWSLRVLPSRFPLLCKEDDLRRRAEGMFDRMSGIGVHEVVVETPDHLATLATFWRKMERSKQLFSRGHL
jgi:UDPglucose--hexose-1-phosphate uridylyltransferase